MESSIRFIGMILLAMLISTAINSAMSEAHLAPKQVATRTGVVEAANNPTPYKVDRQDVQAGDFWMVDQVPC